MSQIGHQKLKNTFNLTLPCPIVKMEITLSPYDRVSENKFMNVSDALRYDRDENHKQAWGNQ